MKTLKRRISKLEQHHSLKEQHPPQTKEERLVWAINQLSFRPSTAKEPLRPEDSPYLILLEAARSGEIRRLGRQLGLLPPEEGESAGN